MYKKLFGIINAHFDVTDQTLIKYYSFVRYWRKIWVSRTVYQLFIDFEKAY